jgi:hypothetical protein
MGNIVINAQKPDIWLKFDEPLGATTIVNSGLDTDAVVATDISGSGILNIGITDNIRGQVIESIGDNFGNKARVIVNNIPSVVSSAPRTFTGWIKHTDTNLKWILNTNGNVANNERFSVQITNNGFLRVFFGSTVTAISPVAFNIDEWNHFGVVYDGANLKLYVNGVLTQTEVATANSNYNIYRFFMSHNNNASSFRIYNNSLSNTDITNIYNDELIEADWTYTTYNPDVFPNNSSYTQPSDASLLTIDMLNNQGFSNVNPDFLNKYIYLIEANFIVDQNNPIETILSNNQIDVQALIDNENMLISNGERDLNNKTIFSNTYPKAFIFRRSAEQTNDNNTYNDWLPDNLLLDGIVAKAMNEEITTVNSEKNIYWLNKYALDYPEKITMLHFNGRSRDPRWENNKFFAGHWMYYPGTKLTNSITATDSILQVNDASVFSTGFGLKSAQKNDDIVMVPLDVSGNKLWNQAEQVTLVAKSNNQIKVIRGRYGTTAQNFTAGVYLAPHVVEGPWGNNNLIWTYNLSVDSPRDANNKRCLDILVDEISNWFEPTGILFALDGIQFDIAPRYINALNGRRVDQDNNGIPDNNSEIEQSKYEQGVIEFYEGLRSQMGDQKLIIADGTKYTSQRVATVLNGVETEGYGDVNDTYKAFSKTINTFNFWKDRNVDFPKLNYVTHKDVESTSTEEFRKRERLVLAASQCLGAGFNSFIQAYTPEPGFSIAIQDEFKKGNDNQNHWLGEPLTDYIDLSLNAPDYWSGNGINELTTTVQTQSCSYTQNNNELNVAINNNARQGVLTFKNVVIPSGDFTFRFDAQALNALNNLSPSIPRIVEIEIIGGVDYSNDAQNILAYIGMDKSYECSYYVRNLGPATVDIQITIEGDGNVSLSNFKLNTAPQALARQFENGVVLANPSTNSTLFNLAQLFPTLELGRLNGQDSSVNDGSTVGDTVIVPALDGLFLKNNATLKTTTYGDTSSFSIYPNPSNGITNIECHQCANKSMTISIYDINGKKLFSKQSKNKSRIPINFSKYNNEIYIIKISNNNFQQSKLFVKQ